MTGSSSSTPFPIGAYLGNPDNSSAANQALFDSYYSSFTGLMGTRPLFFDSYVDQQQTIGNWVGNSDWAASSAAASANAASMTPVIGLPLNSNAAGSLTPDQSYKAFASGQYDSVIKGIVQAWASEGFKNLEFRPGWEMNIQGPTYAGSDAQSQADWVAAFQHVYTVLHQAAAADGVNVQVVWNPSVTNYTNASATTALYPGNNYVDIIGADVYSDIYPYSDGTSPPTYHDWDTGKEDTSVAQFIADPINRMHYWSSPAATEWADDSSGGHSQTLASLIAFAEQNGKPFAVPETGAGNSNAGTDVSDDAAFPQWLASQLAAAQSAGETIAFVNLWDSNGGGNYEFTAATDHKPAEAAAWAKYFGASHTEAASPASGSAPATVTIGTGSDVLALSIAEDAWQGDAQFTVSVDGKQIGGTQTATASHAAGQTQTVDVLGTFAAGTHQVGINFLNDAWGGTAATDRNLYVTGATIDKTAVAGSVLTLMSAGSQSFSFGVAAATPSSGADTVTLQVSEDSWQGDAQFTVAINGQTIGGVYTATASHTQGAEQTISLHGSWGAGAKTIGLSFINDAWGGTATTDRNLYVKQVTYDGIQATGGPATLMSNGTANFTAPAPTVAAALTVNLAEDAWQGNAQYTIAVDGKTLVQAGTATASHALGQSQAINLTASLAAGTHDLAVSFLNDAWGGTAATDRNLYVTGVTVNGKAVGGSIASLMSAGTDHFQITVPSS